ncbi:rna pseudouridylate synthase [Lynx pardinus]|uniref:Rna pseudouridylate synthase n=1 Tax=Lynx pardinus TaxID=191816 RepID=A0A485MI64_LYNPA|nr:rna pseudouridylate synthase [Lynx pardinus]
MRTVLAREMGGCSVLGRIWGVWRRRPGVRAVPKAPGFGTEAGHRLRPRGSSKRSRPLGGQPFPGLLQLENLSREELVDVLRAAVVDQKGPLVTLNKPPGLPVTGKPGELTLFSVLPELSQSLGLGDQELQVVQASGKETSGLVLLSSCPQTASRLQKFFIYSRRAQRPTATYCAVTDGIPATSEGKIQAALKLEHVDGVDLCSPVSSRYTWYYSSALCSGITHTLPAWALSWVSAFYCQQRAPSPKDRSRMKPSSDTSA